GRVNAVRVGVLVEEGLGEDRAVALLDRRGVEAVFLGVLARKRRWLDDAVVVQQDAVLEILCQDAALEHRLADRGAEIEPALVAVVPGGKRSGDTESGHVAVATAFPGDFVRAGNVFRSRAP